MSLNKKQRLIHCLVMQKVSSTTISNHLKVSSVIYLHFTPHNTLN